MRLPTLVGGVRGWGVEREASAALDSLHKQRRVYWRVIGEGEM